MTMKRKNRMGALPIDTGHELAPDHTVPVASPPAATPRPDGRHRNKTGRTVSFGTRVSESFKTKLDELATRSGLKYVEILEKALDLYEQSLAKK